MISIFVQKVWHLAQKADDYVHIFFRKEMAVMKNIMRISEKDRLFAGRFLRFDFIYAKEILIKPDC